MMQTPTPAPVKVSFWSPSVERSVLKKVEPGRISLVAAPVA
jgi:hypothetical protein